MGHDTHRVDASIEVPSPKLVDRDFVWEPRLDDLLTDPVTQSRAAADGLGLADLRRLVDGLRRPAR